MAIVFEGDEPCLGFTIDALLMIFIVVGQCASEGGYQTGKDREQEGEADTDA
jgi:hypothetical protein